MRTGYLLFAEPKFRLELAGITKRIDELGNIPAISEIGEKIKQLNQDGFYENTPEYFNTLMRMLKSPEEFSWKIKKQKETIAPCNLEDLTILAGIKASLILNQDELAQYKKLDFSSTTELLAATSIFESIENKPENEFTTISIDRSVISTTVTANDHGDLVILQKDIAHYDTIDPFGQKILLRPQIEDDNRIVAGTYHQEGILLVALIKYIEQQKLPINSYAKNKAKELIHWGLELGNTRYVTDPDPSHLFFQFNKEIPLINGNLPTMLSTYSLRSNGKRSYDAYIDENGDFVLYRIDDINNIKNNQDNIAFKLKPNKVEDMIKALFMQSSSKNGGGRTSSKLLTEILQYRFSDEFMYLDECPPLK